MDALDREIAAALAVDPSPEFVARVRERIAHAPAPAFWRLPRLMLSAGALAVVVVATVLIGRVDRAEIVADRVPAVVPAVASASVASAFVASGFSRTDVVAPIRRHRVRREPNPIQLVSIEDLPTAPIGDVVPQMTADVVTMTGGTSMINRFRFLGFWLSVGFAMAVVALAPCVAFAQQRGAPASPPVAASSSAAMPMTPLKVQVVVTRMQGQKQVSREPFTLAVNANDDKVSEVQSGTQVFIPMVTVDGKTVGPVFKDVGTHITCTATTIDGRYRLNLTVESALLPEDEKGKTTATPPYRIRSFRSSQPLLMHDGQTMEYTTATDPVNGEEVKVDVSLVVVK